MKTQYIFWITLFLAILCSVLLFVAMTFVKQSYQDIIVSADTIEKREKYDKYRQSAAIVGVVALVFCGIFGIIGGYTRSLHHFCD